MYKNDNLENKIVVTGRFSIDASDIRFLTVYFKYCGIISFAGHKFLCQSHKWYIRAAYVHAIVVFYEDIL